MEAEKVLILRLHILLSRQMPDLRRSSMIDLADTGVESPHATEAGSNRDLVHRQPGFVDELFCKVQPPRLGYRHRSRSQMSQKQAAQMPRPYSQAFRKNFHATVFQSTLTDQTQSPRNRI
jgi:hypothetical protein